MYRQTKRKRSRKTSARSEQGEETNGPGEHMEKLKCSLIREEQSERQRDMILYRAVIAVQEVLTGFGIRKMGEGVESGQRP